MFLLNIYSIIEYGGFYRDFYLVLRNLVDIHYISIEVDYMYNQIVNYALSGSNVYLNDYHVRYAKLHRYVDNLQIYNESLYFPLHDVQNMILSFNDAAKRIIVSYDEKIAQIYINHYVTELSKLKGFIEGGVNHILIEQLFHAQSYYSIFWQEIRFKTYTMYIITALISISCVLLALRFSKEISFPIRELVQRLKKVAQGDLHVQPIKLRTNDEVNILIESFNTMLSDIHNMIKTIQEKANVEKHLREQEIKYLEMSNLLNQSELKLLQSQINPHFLFNTMNSIQTLADLEQANQTSQMLESLSKILRNSLKNVEGYITLQEEYDIIKNYLYIQGIRFGNRFVFDFDVDVEALSHRVPSMILQPFVENAIVHGLEPKEGKGHLLVQIKNKTDHISIVIEDDGIGLSLDLLSQLQNKNGRNIKDVRHGIGIHNVARRLEIEYGENVVDVYSVQGTGTRIAMKIYKNALKQKSSEQPSQIIL